MFPTAGGPRSVRRSYVRPKFFGFVTLIRNYSHLILEHVCYRNFRCVYVQIQHLHIFHNCHLWVFFVEWCQLFVNIVSILLAIFNFGTAQAHNL